MSKICSICGTTNPESAQFCEGCGIELTSGTTTPAQGKIPVQEPEAMPVQEPTATPVPEEAPAEPPSEAPTSSDAGESVDTSPSPESASEGAEETPVEASPDSDARAAPAKLFAKRHGALSSDPIPLQEGRLVVGRFDPSTGPVEIDVAGMAGAEHISRRHAELYTESGVWKVRDLGSTNGVFLKRAGEEGYGPRLQEPVVLNDGDEVAFGNVIFVFRQDDQ